MLDLFEFIPEGWKKELCSSRLLLKEIQERILEHDPKGEKVVPSLDQCFKALEVSPEEVRVIIVGQDPYPRREHAIGKAFAVPNTIKSLPPSLINILKERATDIGGVDPEPELQRWQDQGVLLLNRILTTQEGLTNAHRKFGWESLTERIISCSVANGAVGVLWGREAKALLPLFQGRAIAGVHPSPLSAYRGFFGSKPFSRVNELLHDPIRW